MNHRAPALIGAIGALLIAPLAGQTAGAAAKPRTASAKEWKAPRTSDGHPDLQGIWTNATLTRLERPPELAGKPTLTDAEARAVEKIDLDNGKDPEPGKPLILGNIVFSGANDGYNALFIDRGSELARVDGVKRTSLIVDPPDGKVPPLTAEARQRNTAARARGFDRYDSVKDRPIAERCIVGFGSTSGPPMLPALYNSMYQILQTKDSVMIMVEMIHDVRVIRMNGTHKPAGIRQLLGDSIGHWEGDTLVVDTTNFTDETRFRGASENLHVIERFQRVDSGTILYRATIDDPTTFTQPWTMEYPFLATPGPIYEYACHEGNYAMTDILSGARKADAEAEKK
ncbi:MAG TPA: hypothetical protein VEV17_11145 [Bryobacteraceae bacterium]|nr:hypothetical protein [Bryobacteraceae bacterium]